MSRTRSHRRLVPMLYVAAAFPLGLPAVAHAATPHGAPGPQRSAPAPQASALAKDAVRLDGRRDTDAPAPTTA